MLDLSSRVDAIFIKVRIEPLPRIVILVLLCIMPDWGLGTPDWTRAPVVDLGAIKSGPTKYKGFVNADCTF